MFAERVEPRSSQLTMSNFASAGCPRRSARLTEVQDTRSPSRSRSRCELFGGFQAQGACFAANCLEDFRRRAHVSRRTVWRVSGAGDEAGHDGDEIAQSAAAD